MNYSSLGDLAQAFALRRQNVALRNDINRLNQEVATGMTADAADHLGGSYARLSDIETNIRRLKSFEVNISEAEQFTDAVQSRLEQFSTMASEFSGSLFAVTSTGETAISDALGLEARAHFSSIIGALNSQSAGRMLFSGDATDTAAYVDANEILTELENNLSGVSTSGDLETQVDLWFNDPAGFESFAYTGSDTPISPFKLSNSSQVNFELRGNDPAIRDTLKALAKIVALSSAGASLSTEEQLKVTQNTAENLRGAQSNLIALRANIGQSQEQIRLSKVSTQTERIGLDYAKGALLAVDPYEAATSLEAAQFRLESLYTVTVRLSQLSLVNFLR